MWEKALKEDSRALKYDPAHIKAPKVFEVLENDDRSFDGCNGYKQHKPLLLPNTWHPSIWWNCCMVQDEKKRDAKVVEWWVGR